MTERFYRYCHMCGNRVHMNGKCECGVDPWGIDSKEDAKKSYLYTLYLRSKWESENNLKKAIKDIKKMEDALSKFPAYKNTKNPYKELKELVDGFGKDVCWGIK